jgi:hypothetical protein
MLIKLAAVIILTPFVLKHLMTASILTPPFSIFIIPGTIVATLGGWCGQIYIKAQLSVKREMSNARSPVLGHFGAAISGLGKAVIYFHEFPFNESQYLFEHMTPRWHSRKNHLFASIVTLGLLGHFII